MMSTPAWTSVSPREAPKPSVTRGLTWTGETNRGGEAEGEAAESGLETAPSPAAGVGRVIVGVGTAVRVEVGAYATAAGAGTVGLMAAEDGGGASDPEPGRTRNRTVDTSASAPPMAAVAMSQGRREEPRLGEAGS